MLKIQGSAEFILPDVHVRIAIFMLSMNVMVRFCFIFIRLFRLPGKSKPFPEKSPKLLFWERWFALVAHACGLNHAGLSPLVMSFL